MRPPKDTVKTVELTYTQTNTDSFVFVRVNAENWAFEETSCRYSMLDQRVYWYVDSGWTYLLSDGTSQVYYTVVPAGGFLAEKPVVAEETVYVADEITHHEYHQEAQQGTMSATFDGFAAPMDDKFDSEAESAAAAWNEIME